ncbi:MAG: RDD family protein, partial [Caldilineaceae bacterium]|nr:RDD family protein [Caldilineaceae bacterium]
MVESNQWLQEEYTIDTPENVSFGFDVAGIGSRFIGALVDTVILGLALLLLNAILGFVLELVGAETFVDPFLENEQDPSWVVGLVVALYVLLNFVLLTGYYILFELIWNGQTVGKRVAHIRVVRVNGNPAGFLEIVVRNLIRMVDFLPM